MSPDHDSHLVCNDVMEWFEKSTVWSFDSGFPFKGLIKAEISKHCNVFGTSRKIL